MTETLLALVPTYGAWLVFAATFLSCLAIPAPSSLIMLAAGAFVASGDLNAYTVIGSAYAGAILGDQIGYWIGRTGGANIWAYLRKNQSTVSMLDKAEDSLKQRDFVAVYLTRWLFSAVGPYVNLLCGATKMSWARFTAADLAGEATWVAVYVGLGISFASQIETLGATLGNLAGALGAGLIAFLVGRVLWRAAREGKSQ